MTFWHSLASFKVHLAHLPSPVIVTVSSAAATRFAVPPHPIATPAAIASSFFILQPFNFELSSSALLTNIKDKPSSRPVQFKGKQFLEKFGWSFVELHVAQCPLVRSANNRMKAIRFISSL